VQNDTGTGTVGMSAETHRVPVEGDESVVIDWYPAAPGARVALYVHGLGSHRRGEKALYFAARFNALGWAFAAVDLRGHGAADGRIQDLTMSRLLADVAATRDWLERRTPARPLLIGSSMGAAVVAWDSVLRQRSSGPLVLLAPSLTFPAGVLAQLSAAELETWRQCGVRRFRSEWIDLEIGFDVVADAERYDPGQLRRELRTPTLIVHGVRDRTIPASASLDFATHCAAVDVYLVGDGDHRLTDARQKVFDVLWSWLAQVF
jgi:pimeloyl-ACP methyl ester carboxylesterase